MKKRLKYLKLDFNLQTSLNHYLKMPLPVKPNGYTENEVIKYRLKEYESYIKKLLNTPSIYIPNKGSYEYDLFLIEAILDVKTYNKYFNK